MRPLPKEPDSDEKKKRNAKNKMRLKDNKDKPNISYPTNFEHTVHVGFDAITGEFTVRSLIYFCLYQNYLKYNVEERFFTPKPLSNHINRFI